MHTSGSILRTILERIRTYLDEPDVDAKFSDDYVVRHAISPAMVDVLSRLNNTSQSPVVLTFEVTTVEDQLTYLLPPCIQQVLRLVVMNSSGDILSDSVPRDMMHRLGANWSLEGNPGALTLRFVSVQKDTTFQVWYTSNGDVSCHIGEGTLAAASGSALDTLTLATAPSLGSLDRRPGAYVGQYLRLIPQTAGGAIEERIIESHTRTSATVWKVVVREPFTYASAGTVTYEIVPCGISMLTEAVAAWASSKLGTARKISQEHMGRILVNYRAALKTIGDNLTSIQGRMPHAYTKDTVDNSRGSMLFGWHPLR